MTETSPLDKFMGHIFRPGAVHLTSGTKGGGKTHTAVAVAEQLVKGAYPSVGKVVVATNIIFFHKKNARDDSIVTETPEGIFHIETMKDLFPIVADTIEKYGRDKVLILLILDEAQNFLLGDVNYGNLTVAMKEFMGIIRKFNMAVWFLTPADRNVGPAFRNFMNDERDPGNVTVKWRKDPAINLQYIRQKKLKMEPRELITVKSYDMSPVFLRVPVTNWTKTVETLKSGEYCYDHVASATFKVGSDFDFEDFNDKMGGVSSLNAMSTIRNYYKQHSKEAVQDIAENMENERQANIAFRLRKLGLTWEAVSFAVDVPVSTIKLRVKKFCTISDDNDEEEVVAENTTSKTQKKTVKTNQKQPKTPKTPLLKKTKASKNSNSQNEGSLTRNIYISNEGAHNRGVSAAELSKPSFEESSEKGMGGASDAPIPDGRYTFDEMGRAVEYCMPRSE